MECIKIEEDIREKELKIMIIDDNPDDRTLAIRELKKQFNDLTITEIKNRSEFEIELDKKNFDLVITDYRLRWTTGLDVLKKIKSRCPDTPVIMFTGTGTEEVAVEAMKIGLEDYVVKSPKHFLRLPVSVKKAIERKEKQEKAEEAVEKSELKYKAIFENTGTKSFIFGENNIIEIVNDQFEKMSGYTRDEISGKISWKEFILEEEYEKFEGYINTAEEDEDRSPEYFSIGFVNRYNDKRNVLTSLNTIPKTDKIVCSMLDITRYKETLDALTASEEMFRVAFESSPIGIMLLSLDGEIEEVNRSMCELLEISEGELLTANCKDILHMNDFNKLIDGLEKLKRGKLKISEKNLRFSFLDKESKNLNIISSLIKDPKGDPLYYLMHVYE
ncbi:MAG: PAS domain S-box protein [Candidatus Saliniplasma sp.]